MTLNSFTSQKERLTSSLHRKRKNSAVPQTDPFQNPTHLTVSHLNRELDVIISKKTRLIRATSQQTEMMPFPIWTENSTLLHRKRLNSSVLHPNRLNRFLFEHRFRRCYMERDKTEPFHIPTDWTVFHLSRELDVVTSKKKNLNRSTAQQTEPSQAGCVIESTRLLRNAHLKRASNLFRKYHKS